MQCRHWNRHTEKASFIHHALGDLDLQIKCRGTLPCQFLWYSQAKIKGETPSRRRPEGAAFSIKNVFLSDLSSACHRRMVVTANWAEPDLPIDCI